MNDRKTFFTLCVKQVYVLTSWIQMVNFDLFNPNLISRNFFHFLQFWWEWRTMIHSREIMQLQNGSKNTWNICLSIKTKMEAMDNVFFKEILLMQKNPWFKGKIIPYLCDIEHTLKPVFYCMFFREIKILIFYQFLNFRAISGFNFSRIPS